MYRALKPIRVRNPEPSQAALQLQVGDEVPGFAGWAQWTQEAMIQQGQVRWAPEGLAPHEAKAAERQVVQHLPSHAGAVTNAPPERLGELAQHELLRAAQPQAANAGTKPPAEALHQPDGLVDLAVGPNSAAEHAEYRPMPAAVEAQAGETIFKEMGPAGGIPSQFGEVVPSKLPPQKGAHDCHLCDRTGFKDYNGLRIHIARAHRPDKQD